ncbi:MAG: hypothetical protein ACLFR1_04090 [Spirochaetia bacterium]
MDKVYIKRKNYVIDKSFQYRLIATFLISVIIALALFTAGVFGYYWYSSMVGDNLFSEFITIHKQVTQEQEVEVDGETVVEEYYNTVDIPGVKRWELVLPPIIVNNVVIMVIITIMGLFYSHRIAGPAYRMSQDIQRVLNGEQGVRIKLRKHDKLKELADRVNELLEYVDEIRES